MTDSPADELEALRAEVARLRVDAKARDEELNAAAAELAALRAAIDAAAVDALAESSMAAFAPLVSDLEIAARLGRQTLGKPQEEQRLTQARATNILLRRDLQEKRKDVIEFVVRKTHFDGAHHGSIRRILTGALSNSILQEAARLADWILRHSPTRLERLRRLTSEKSDAASGNTDAYAPSDGR